MGGVDIVEAANREDVSPDRPRVEDPSTEREHAHERERVRADHGYHGDGEHDHREGELHVRHPHDDGVRPCAPPARGESHDDAHHRGDGDGGHGEGQGDTPAIEQASQDIERILTEQRPPATPSATGGAAGGVTL